MDNKFKDLMTTLFYDEPHDCFVIPAMKRDELKPEISKEEFVIQLERIWDYCQEVCRTFKQLHWDDRIDVVAEVIQQVSFDGQGYSIPYFGVYVNEKPEDQIITNVMQVPSIAEGRKEFIQVTDFSKDTVMGKFVHELYANLPYWESWLKQKKSSFGQQIPEFTQQLNEDDFGKKELAKPYEKKIDNLLNKSE